MTDSIDLSDIDINIGGSGGTDTITLDAAGYPNYYTSSGILVLPDKTFMRTYRYTHKIHGVCVDDINI